MATIKEIITKIEGNKSAPYYDGVGKITIGIGFNIESVSKSRNAVFVNLGLVKTKEDAQGNIIAALDTQGNLQVKTLYKTVNGVKEIDTVATNKLNEYFTKALELITKDSYNGSKSPSELKTKSQTRNQA